MGILTVYLEAPGFEDHTGLSRQNKGFRGDPVDGRPAWETGSFNNDQL